MRLRVEKSTALYRSLTAAAIVGTALWATGLWRWSAWQLPAAYSIDALEVLARLKLSGQLGLAFFFDKTMPPIGAPWGADWSSYPMPDAPLFILFGKIGATIGLIPASNLALLFAHLSAVAVFYLCSRALGHRTPFATGAAVLFGFSFYLLHRSLSHFSFTLAYVVPAQLLHVWLIGSGHQLLRLARWRWFGIATAVATGMGNPYFGFAYCLLMGGALAYQAATARRRANLRWGGICLAIFFGTLVLLNYSSLLAMLRGDSGLERNYAATELYGLRPIEWFIPPPSHRWGEVGAIGERYAAVSTFKGELFSPYFGLAGLAGLLCMIGSIVRRWRRGGPRARPGYAAAFSGITIFFVIGGINSLLAFGGLDLFRAGNRYSIYLLALALFALASWASRAGRRVSPVAAVVITTALVAIGLWDQVPKPRSSSANAALANQIAIDREVGAALDTQLPAGAAVFQLPAVPFLEQPPVHAMTDYELFRPWLFTERTRFSYGLLANERALRWERYVATLPTDLLCAALEEAGYAALYLNKSAFSDGGAQLRSQLKALGKKVLVQAGEHIVFALQPVHTPRLPDLNDARLSDPWHTTLVREDQFHLYAGEGWFPLEHDSSDSWRWAGNEATLLIWSSSHEPQAAELTLEASALRPGVLIANFNRKIVWRVNAGPAPIPKANLFLTLQPGSNLVTFRFNGRAVRPSNADSRILGFKLSNLRIAPKP
ncbi:MAG: hypothetical protein HZA32_19005 [Opitutae bacterium]|nr:hypothetical protein [Opitutae bacterium]